MNIKQKYGKVVVIMGGDSAERDISLISGMAVLSALKEHGVDVYKFDPAVDSITELVSQGFSRAVLMTHGKHGEDGVLQGALELFKIPYTGSGVMTSSLAMDKYRTKLIWQSFGIPVPKGQHILKHMFDVSNFKLEIDLPVVVKPVGGGSTLGLSKVYKIEQLLDAIHLAFEQDKAVLIEEMVVGDEFTITVYDGVVYPIVKIIAPKDNYDYHNKYFANDTKYICPFDLGSMQQQVEDYALNGYNAVGARGIARLDFMLNSSNQLYFLEINTLPGMTSHSLVPMSFLAKGVSFLQLCLNILDGATLDG